MKNFTKMNRITAAILAVLMMTAGILQTVPVSAAIKEADVFLNSNWSYAGESTPFEDGGWLQAICDTEDYIIGVENASNTSTDPDTLVAFYKNNYDENGNPVDRKSVV